ncbi:MAG: nitrile hydratase subunit beta [Acetobacteraceae bacterium]|nr:nitrile hydratase subunit beta [Pseudomonadota bacterium]
MNGVHDMGGMHGLGPLVPEQNEPVWHAPWEARVFALTSAIGAWRKWNLDESRQQIERMPGADYLRSSYYEKWLIRTVALAIQTGLLTREEAMSGRPDPAAQAATPPLKAAQVEPSMRRGGPTTRSVDRQPVFRVGDSVRTRNIHPQTHTRLPRYARDKQGVVVALHGAHVFPDSNALRQGENAQPLYTVRFKAQDLWGEAANARDTVCIDLWEDYLAPV